LRAGGGGVERDYFLRQPVTQGVSGAFQVEIHLQPQPELRCGPQGNAQTQGGGCRDGALVLHDVVYFLRRHAHFKRQFMLADAQRF